MLIPTLKVKLDEEKDQRELLKDFKPRILTYDNYDIQLYEKGNRGDSIIIFIHGWLAEASNWSIVANLLSEDFFVVTVDLLGHGKSDVPDEPFTLDLFADSVIRIIESFGMKVWLVGHSMGGAITQEIIRRRNDLLLGTCLVSTGLEFNSYLPTRLLEVLMPRSPRMKTLMRDIGEQFMKAMYKVDTEYQKMVVKVATDIIFNLPETSIIRPYKELIKPWDIRKEPPVADIPIHIICGKSDFITSLDQSIHMNMYYPQSTLKVISSGNHQIPLTHPVEVANSIYQFIVLWESKLKSS